MKHSLRETIFPIWINVKYDNAIHAEKNTQKYL